MPREQINYPQDRFAENVPDGVTAVGLRDSRLHLNWSLRESFSSVQVSLEIPIENVRAVAADADHLSERGTVFFYTPELSRSELNKLIRSLRIARDKVHGRDE